MTRTQGLLGLVVIVGLAGAAGASCGHTPCTPEEYDVEGNLLASRGAPGILNEGDCKAPGLRILTSEEELRAFYDSVGAITATAADGGAPTLIDGEYPIVDFTRERVVVSESSTAAGIIWSVASNETLVVGMASCFSAAKGCTVTASVVPTTLSRFETRTCDRIQCGRPPARRGR